MKKINSVICVKYRKYCTFLEKHQFFLLLAISREFRLKNIKETKNYFIKEIDQNELMNKNHKIESI